MGRKKRGSFGDVDRGWTEQYMAAYGTLVNRCRYCGETDATGPLEHTAECPSRRYSTPREYERSLG
jgi:hypothetical protein